MHERVSIDQRRLQDLVSIGPSMLRDLEALGIQTIAQLKRENPQSMYRRLCRLKGPQDICCLDVFKAAVAQARDPNLPIEQRRWWYWSRVRKRRLTPTSSAGADNWSLRDGLTK